MADADSPDQAPPVRRSLLTLAGGFALGALALWLTADQEVVALESPHDDQFFLQRAACAYWFDGQGYTHMSFIKEPVYPLFAWLCYRLGISLRLATEVVYLAAAAFFSCALVRRRSCGWVGLLVFAACALHPMRFAVFRQTTSDALYPALLLAALGALTAQLRDAELPGRWRRGLVSGLLLGLLWNTRPERPLVALLLLFFLAAGLCRAQLVAVGWRARAQRWLAEWALTPAALAAVTVAVMTANYARFGVFATTDMSAPGYWSAYRALVGIQPERPVRFVPVTRDALRQAYAASPTFRQLEPFLEGEMGRAYAGYGHAIAGLPPGEVAGGWFCWLLRDAAAAAGLTRSAAESEAFYRRVVEELRSAAAAGTLQTRTVPPFGLDPCSDNYLLHLPASVAKLLARCWSGEEPPPPADHPTAIREFYDAVTHRRPVSPPPTAQAGVRSWLWSVYGPLLNSVLLAGALVAALVLLRRQVIPERGWYFLMAAAVAVAGFSRLGLFALIDASAFPGDALRYLFPAALVLSALAAWLAAEGARLLREGQRRP
jgi:hypothetical protein